MSWLSMLAAAGVWPALPLTGYLLLARSRRFRSLAVPAVTAVALMSVAGLAVWSVLLLGAAVAGAYRGDIFGLLGWSVSAVALIILLRDTRAHKEATTAGPTKTAAGPKMASVKTPRRSRSLAASPPRDLNALWNAVLMVGLAAAAVLYFGFPTESIYGGRDEGVYSTHAIRIARTGRLDVPYPWPPDADAIFAPNWVGFPGFYKTQPTMTVQFGHLFPLWLAQAYSTATEEGLFRFNAAVALLSAAVFYGVCRMLLPVSYAVLATLFFAFNPSQLWMARITLSEILTQLLTWSGLLLLLHAWKSDDRAAARWAGAFFGLSAFVRFDSLLLVPLLLFAHAAQRFLRPSDATRSSIWPAVYQTALPIALLALGYFAIFSTPYLMERYYWQKLVGASVVAALVLLASSSRVTAKAQPWLASTPFLIAVSAGATLLAAYTYWIRPLPVAPPRLRYMWPGYQWDGMKGNYSADSLVNLSRYLSPLVVWGGIAGWLVALWGVARAKRDAGLLMGLIIFAGMAVVYLYDHGNTPDHFWLIRRFVVVVIPALIVCATLAAHRLLTSIPSGWSLAASVVLVAFLAAFTVRADALIATFVEDEGYFAQLQHLADKLPHDDVILARGFTSWVTPLTVAFDRKVVPLNLDRGGKGRQVLSGWVARQANQGRPVYLLMEGAADLSAFQVRQLNTFVVTRSFAEPTTDPLPKKIVKEERQLTLYEIHP
jgi:hypothetical protein